jgi:hypothetical protein
MMQQLSDVATTMFNASNTASVAYSPNPPADAETEDDF